MYFFCFNEELTDFQNAKQVMLSFNTKQVALFFFHFNEKLTDFPLKPVSVINGLLHAIYIYIYIHLLFPPVLFVVPESLSYSTAQHYRIIYLKNCCERRGCFSCTYRAKCDIYIGRVLEHALQITT